MYILDAVHRSFLFITKNYLLIFSHTLSDPEKYSTLIRTLNEIEDSLREIFSLIDQYSSRSSYKERNVPPLKLVGVHMKTDIYDIAANESTINYLCTAGASNEDPCHYLEKLLSETQSTILSISASIEQLDDQSLQDLQKESDGLAAFAAVAAAAPDYYLQNINAEAAEEQISAIEEVI